MKNWIACIAVLTALSLTACSGLGVGWRSDSDATYAGGYPVVTDPENQSNVDDIVNPAIEEFAENAPANPTDWVSWLYAAAASVTTAAAAAAGIYLRRRKNG